MYRVTNFLIAASITVLATIAGTALSSNAANSVAVANPSPNLNTAQFQPVHQVSLHDTMHRPIRYKSARRLEPTPIQVPVSKPKRIHPTRQTQAAQPTGSPQQYALSLVGQAQFSCLLPLWNQESGWNTYATNPSSGAYGIPQALPGSKMASAGLDWQTNAYTQIRWGVGYIQSTYGTPCNAWAHEQANGWY